MFPQMIRARFTTIGMLVGLGACASPDAPTDVTQTLTSVSVQHNNSAEATQLVELRQLTARFHNFEAAKAAGYETQITPCWEHAAHGGQGYHWGNVALIDATADLLNPELLMYEPQAGGGGKLIGVEYVVPLAAWEAAGHNLSDPNDVPELLGQKFTRHSFLPILKLHIWLWANNPAGMFADWNPKVSCERAEESEIFQ